MTIHRIATTRTYEAVCRSVEENVVLKAYYEQTRAKIESLIEQSPFALKIETYFPVELEKKDLWLLYHRIVYDLRRLGYGSINPLSKEVNKLGIEFLLYSADDSTEVNLQAELMDVDGWKYDFHKNYLIFRRILKAKSYLPEIVLDLQSEYECLVEIPSSEQSVIQLLKTYIEKAGFHFKYKKELCHIYPNLTRKKVVPFTTADGTSFSVERLFAKARSEMAKNDFLLLLCNQFKGQIANFSGRKELRHLTINSKLNASDSFCLAFNLASFAKKKLSMFPLLSLSFRFFYGEFCMKIQKYPDPVGLKERVDDLSAELISTIKIEVKEKGVFSSVIDTINGCENEDEREAVISHLIMEFRKNGYSAFMEEKTLIVGPPIFLGFFSDSF